MKKNNILVILFPIYLKEVTASIDLKIPYQSIQVGEKAALQPEHSSLPRPHIINDLFSKKIVSSGSKVVLNCTVNEELSFPISWIYENETLVLNNPRNKTGKKVQKVYGSSSRDFSISISHLNTNDSGYYICRLNSPNPMSIKVKLVVKDAYSVIFGSTEVSVAAGSTIYLFCMILEVNDLPDYILWYHNKLVIDYYRPNIEVTLDAETRSSELRIHNVSFSDSGVYTCKPSNAAPSKVTVFVHSASNTPKGKAKDLTEWILLIQMLATFTFFFSSYFIAYVFHYRRKVLNKRSTGRRESIYYVEDDYFDDHLN